MQLDQLVLTGRGALVRNIDSYLTESLGITVGVGNPMLKIGNVANGIDGDRLAAISPRLAVAIGLALDEGE